MRAFLTKDLKLILRDRGELALLLLMPMVLIAILGFALGGLLGGSDQAPVHVDAMLVVEDEIGEGRRGFRQALTDSDVPLAQRAGLLVAQQAFDPIEIVRGFLGNEDLGELLTVTEGTAAEAEVAMAAGEIQATITVPAGFSQAMYQRMLLERGDSAEIGVRLSDDAPLGTSIVVDLLQGFAEEFNLQTALQQIRSEQGTGLPLLPGIEAATRARGGVEIISGETREVSSFAYYAFGMAVMFMLYLVGSTAVRAYLELADNSFDRIIVSDANPLAFVLSKALAAAVVGFAQMMVLVTASHLLFGALDGQPPSYWGQVALITAAMALAVGAVAGLVTAVVFRTGNRGLADAFNSVVVFVFAALGGSFVPLGDSGSLLARLGDWTPNGAALSSLLAAARGGDIGVWGVGPLRLVIMAAVAIALAVALFPRSRSA